MAADSMTNVYDRPIIGGCRKILRIAAGPGEVLVGFCGDVGIPGLMASGLNVDEVPAGGEDPQPWADAVACAATGLAVAAGCVEDGRLAGSLLLGWDGRLWTLVHCGAVPHADGVAAVGSGEGPAIGALDAFLETGMAPGDAVRAAVLIGIRRDRHSAGPVQVEVLEPVGRPARLATAARKGGKRGK